MLRYMGLVWLIGRAGPDLTIQTGYVVTDGGLPGDSCPRRAPFGRRRLALAPMLAGMALGPPRIDVSFTSLMVFLLSARQVG